MEFEIIDTDNTRVRARSLYQVEEESLINRDGKVFRNPFIRQRKTEFSRLCLPQGILAILSVFQCFMGKRFTKHGL